MPKKKSPKKKTPSPPKRVSDTDLLALCRDNVREMLSTGEYDVKLGSHLAWLENMAAKTMNERAKIAEREEKRLRAISWGQAVAWAKHLSEPEWAKYIRDVEGSGRGSVLG